MKHDAELLSTFHERVLILNVTFNACRKNQYPVVETTKINEANASDTWRRRLVFDFVRVFLPLRYDRVTRGHECQKLGDTLASFLLYVMAKTKSRSDF